MSNQIQVPVIDFDDLAIEFLSEAHRTPRFIAWMQGMFSGGIKWINANFWNYCYGDSISGLWDYSTSYVLNDKVITNEGVFISTVNTNLNNKPYYVPFYSSSATYSVGYSILYNEKYYQCIVDIPSPESFNPSKWKLLSEAVWYKISPSYIGAQERIQWTAQKLNMEYNLNRWFSTDFRNPTAFTDGSVSGQWYTPLSDIWIQTKNYTFLSFGVCKIGQEKGSVRTIPTIYGVGTDSITALDSSYQYRIWIPSSLAISLGSSYRQIIIEIANKMNPIGLSFTVQTY